MYEDKEILDVSQILSRSGDDPQIERQHDNSICNQIKILSCNANPLLASEIARNLGCRLCDCEVGKFADGEIYTKIFESIRGADVYIVQPTSPPVNDNLMELLIMIDALKRASAGKINVVAPYFAYARQDRKARARDPISAKLVANLITCAGASRVITMDLHCPQIQGFFDIPVDNILGFPILTKYFTSELKISKENTVVVSPDIGSITRVRAFAERLEMPIAIIDKRRPKPNESEIMNIIGDVKGKNVIIADDMTDTAGTLTNAAKALKNLGANEIYACCTHAVLSGKAVERIEESPINQMVVLDTIKLDEAKMSPKIKQLSVAGIFAEAIWRIHNGQSVSTLFV